MAFETGPSKRCTKADYYELNDSGEVCKVIIGIAKSQIRDPSSIRFYPWLITYPEPVAAAIVAPQHPQHLGEGKRSRTTSPEN